MYKTSVVIAGLKCILSQKDKIFSYKFFDAKKILKYPSKAALRCLLLIQTIVYFAYAVGHSWRGGCSACIEYNTGIIQSYVKVGNNV